MLKDIRNRVDSAVDARPGNEESLQTIQPSLLKLVEQGQTDFQIESLSLELLRETLAEARAARMGLWESLAGPALKADGKGTQEIARLLETQSSDAKNFAYGLAEEVRDELSAVESNPATAAVAGDDRQGSSDTTNPTRAELKVRKPPLEVVLPPQAHTDPPVLSYTQVC